MCRLRRQQIIVHILQRNTYNTANILQRTIEKSTKLKRLQYDLCVIEINNHLNNSDSSQCLGNLYTRLVNRLLQ